MTYPLTSQYAKTQTKAKIAKFKKILNFYLKARTKSSRCFYNVIYKWRQLTYCALENSRKRGGGRTEKAVNNNQPTAGVLITRQAVEKKYKFLKGDGGREGMFK